jgi:hypothetical protein
VEAKKTHSSRLPIKLSTFVGPTNFLSHYLHLLGQQICLPIFFPYTPLYLCFVALARTATVPVAWLLWRGSSPVALLPALQLPGGAAPPQRRSSPVLQLTRRGSTSPTWVDLPGAGGSPPRGRQARRHPPARRLARASTGLHDVVPQLRLHRHPRRRPTDIHDGGHASTSIHEGGRASTGLRWSFPCFPSPVTPSYLWIRR